MDARTLRREMVERLVAAGAVSEDWRRAFDAVPRHLFIPDLIWCQGDRGLLPHRRAEDPEGWLAAAYADDAVITQVDDGEPSGSVEGEIGLTATSSASMPTVVAEMLMALKAGEEMRVCEIGTGTGYNAALLAQRLGARNVVTVEVDPTVAEAARHSLERAGYGGVTVITADGSQGAAPGAPYDRVISTASCEQVPYPWVAQTAPGGMVLTPCANSYYPGGLLSLTVVEDGTATGRIVGPAWFMELRDQRIPRCRVADVVRGDYQGERSTTTIEPYELAGHRGAMLAIGLRVPHCLHRYLPYDPDDGTGELWFLDPWSGSWASHFHFTPDCSDEEFSIRQRGPRRLWDEVEAAHGWWAGHGRPGEHEWRFTVTSGGQTVALQ